MRLLSVILMATAGVLATISGAEAAGGCARGWFWDGYRCVPRYQGPSHYYAPRYVQPPRYAPRAYYGPSPYYGYGYGYRARPSDNELAGCPRYWTLQDGVCKPYRGY